MNCSHENEIYLDKQCGVGGITKPRYRCAASWPDNKHPTRAELCEYCQIQHAGYEE